MHVYVVSSLLTILVLALSTAQAKTFDIAAVSRTQSGRQVFKATNGNFYVELKPGEGMQAAATAQEVYEAYRGQLRALMVGDTSGVSDGSEPSNAFYADPILNQNINRRAKRGVLGISLRTLKLIQGAATLAPNIAERAASEMSNQLYTPDVAYDTGKNLDVLLVRTCPRLRQHSDALDDQTFDCHPSLTVLVKFSRPR